MEKRPEMLLEGLQRDLEFFSDIGIGFVFEDTSHALSLSERIVLCRKCPLSGKRENAVPGEGNIEADLMFVGEAPGRDEDIQGRPFVGRAGRLLTKIINAMQRERKDVYITNVVKCRPPNNRTPNPDEIEQCKGYLLEQLGMIQPRVVVALGKVATDFFIRSRQGITALRGDFYDFQGIKVMPTFHPSYILRNEGNKKIKKMVWEDMKKVMAFLGIK